VEGGLAVSLPRVLQTSPVQRNDSFCLLVLRSNQHSRTPILTKRFFCLGAVEVQEDFVAKYAEALIVLLDDTALLLQPPGSPRALLTVLGGLRKEWSDSSLTRRGGTNGKKKKIKDGGSRCSLEAELV
jgi:hypothetical protein